MTSEELHDFFESKHDEFLRFDRIQNKLSQRPDLHAFLLLDSLAPQKGDMIIGSEHDEIYLGVDVEKLLEVVTEQQLIDLHRCGVRYHEDHSCFCMFA